MIKKFSNNVKNFFLKFKEINNISKKKPRFIFYSENKSYLKYKILANGNLTSKLNIEADFSSISAKEKIEKLGGELKIKNSK